MKLKKNLTRFTYETTAFQGWRLCISRGGKTFMRYFSDKQCGDQPGVLASLLQSRPSGLTRRAGVCTT